MRQEQEKIIYIQENPGHTVVDRWILNSLKYKKWGQLYLHITAALIKRDLWYSMWKQLCLYAANLLILIFEAKSLPFRWMKFGQNKSYYFSTWFLITKMV